jgi:hypothetical protein
MRGVREVCKRIQCHLLHSARVRCLAASAMAPQGYENKWLPLHTLTSSHIVSCCLPVVLGLEEREKRG